MEKYTYEVLNYSHQVLCFSKVATDFSVQQPQI